MTREQSRIGRGRGFGLQLVAGGIVTAALLLGAEVIARLIVGAPPARPASVAAAHDQDYVATTLSGLELVPELNPSPLVQDPFVLWRNKPLARKTQPMNPEVFGHPDTWTIENDSEGYRGPERPFRDAPEGDVYRIVCVGDSVTFGFSVDQADAYPRRLETLLRRRHPGRSIDVVNTAVPGWSWVQGLRFLEVEGWRLQPDLVIAAHGTNDQFWPAVITDRERMPAPGVPAPEMRPPTVLERTSLYRLLQRVGRRLREVPEPSPGCRPEIARGEPCRRVSVADITRTVGEMAEQVRAAGSDFIVLNLDFMATASVRGVREAVATHGLTFRDFVARFRDLQAAEDRAEAARFGLRAPGILAAAVPGRPRRIVFRVRVPPSFSPPVTVRGSAYFREDVRFEAPLHDHGTAGDEVARDGVFSGIVDVPPDVGAIEYMFWLADTQEFTSLPPLRSSSAGRLLLLGGETVAPVAGFAERARMAERTHPNAAGQALIAQELADLVEDLPSFRAWRDRL